MISNAVTLINPYYLSLGICDRLQRNTKYLKGDGFVLEQGFYQDVANLQQGSAFNRAFKDEKYIAYASQNIYLNDNECLIDKMNGRNRYIVTVKYNGKLFSIKYYYDEGLYYVDSSADESYPDKIVINANEQDSGFRFTGDGSLYIQLLRKVFECGNIRFKNQQCKSLLFDMLKYKLVT